MEKKEKMEWLARYKDAMQQENTLLEELQWLRADAERVSAGLGGTGGGSAPSIDRLPRAVERIDAARADLETRSSGPWGRSGPLHPGMPSTAATSWARPPNRSPRPSTWCPAGCGSSMTRGCGRWRFQNPDTLFPCTSFGFRPDTPRKYIIP